MSLNWDITDIKNNDEICKVQDGTDKETGEPLYRLAYKTEALIFATISVGIGHISEGNAAEFYARLRIVEGTRGAMCYGPDKVPEIAEKIVTDLAVSTDFNDAVAEGSKEIVIKALREAGVGGMKDRDAPFTIEDIKAHIGLRTNVSFETREEWARRLIIGQGDKLTTDSDGYPGMRLMTDDEWEAFEQEQFKLAEKLNDEGRYKEARVIEDRIERFDVTITRDLINAYNTFKDTDKAGQA